MREEITKILGFGSQNTYYTWKKENRPIIKLLQKYFNKEDLEEFLQTEKIQKMEQISRNEDNKSLITSITMSHYESYINQVIDESDYGFHVLNEIWSDENDGKNINNIMSEFPIFVFFEYIFQYNRLDDFDNPTRHFAHDIIKIYSINKYKGDKDYMSDATCIFQTNNILGKIFYIFTDNKSFSIYYNLKRSNYEIKNKHAYYHSLYLEIKDIQAMSESENYKEEELIYYYSTILNNRYNSKTNYLKLII